MLPNPKMTALGSEVRTEGVFVDYPMPKRICQYLLLINGVVVRWSDV